MSDYKILAVTWWTPPIVGLLYDALTGISQNLCIGAVAIETNQGKNWKAYLGYGTTGNEEIDAQSIAKNGVKVSKAEAAGMFPELNIEDFVY